MRTKDLLDILHFEEIDFGVDDTVTDGGLHLDEVVVAGHHQGLLGDVITLRYLMWGDPREIGLLTRCVAAETNLNGTNSVSLNANHTFDGPGPAIA